MSYAELSTLFARASDIPETDTSYMLPWSLEMLYEIEPDLMDIAKEAVSQKRRRFYAKHEAYNEAKNAANELLGWGARDPRLRSSGAWDCFFRYILNELNI